MPRLIVANLECEQDWATPDKRPRALPKEVLARISAAGTLMAALGRPGDVLWTPAPVERERALLAHARGVVLSAAPRETLASAYAHAEGLAAWGETGWVHRLRAGIAGHAGEGESALVRALFELVPEVDRARACNDRRYAFALARELGELLPGARILSSVDELEAHLLAGGHHYGHHFGHAGAGGDTGAQRTWVLEAPFAASGRFRLRRRGPLLEPAVRTRAYRLFKTFGQLIFQPWVERLLDVGCVGLVSGPDAWSIIGQHTLEVDNAGVFRGIVVGDAGAPDEARALVREQTLERTRALAERVAERLARDGYRGPFGIDAFAYRDPEGAVRVYPLCEINARSTFGLLAHVLARAYDCRRSSLCLGERSLPESGPRVVHLLAPGSADSSCAWLELDEEVGASRLTGG